MSVNRAAGWAWLFLVGASLATLVVVESHATRADVAVGVVMILAAIKARLIVLHFMELKHAPLAWRVAFEGWVVVVAALIAGLWFFTNAGMRCAG
ncbi:MAG TPA: cytochrome C oxidase subunit IV family protein [Nevskiaceae bacterium]|nr:cytochrome C oxidase subunit IV family protein [Nevskiaceae bacterium]